VAPVITGVINVFTVTATAVVPEQPVLEVTVTVYVPLEVKALVADAVLAPPLHA
jgi:hypothetical protein